MLTFTQANEEIKNAFVEKLCARIKKCDLKTTEGNCYDKDLVHKMENLITLTETGFIFDANSMWGVEPYGYVSDFFDGFLLDIKALKKQYPVFGVEGRFWMNDFGAYECVLCKRIWGNPDDSNIQLLEQLQCINCHQWIDAENAYEKIYDEEVVWTEDNDCLYPNACNEDEAVFCFCSEECKNEFDC